MSTFTFDSKSINANSKLSLFEMVGEQKIPSSCKKTGKCKECLVEIKSGTEFLSPMTKEEQHLMPQYRLSCQTYIHTEGDVVAQSLRRTQIKIEDTGVSSLHELTLDPAIYRQGNDVYMGDNIIDTTDGPILGLAIDIGTTTVVVRLIDLENRTVITNASFENPQRFAGSNVMARIVYDTEHGKKELKRVITAHISNTILSICETPENIYEVMIGGNTTMRDLFFGLDVYTIGQTPYKSLSEFDLENGLKVNTSVESNARKMQLPIHPKARVYGLPIIGGHVGADTSACLLAINMMEEEKLIAFMDIGTNTEIVIGNNVKSITASSPSGPAFEGGGITFGMPALEGAIAKVSFVNGKIEIKTIDDKPPVGICGSGLIDVLGELARTEKINEVGRYNDDIELMYIDDLKKVYVSENDINLLAQTKAANIAALHILFEQYGALFEEVDTFYLAGGFGKHIDIEAGVRIGLLPDIPREKYKKIGNATIEGLTIALLSKSRRQKLESFVKEIPQVSLESDPNFFDYFVDGCLFLENVEV